MICRGGAYAAKPPPRPRSVRVPAQGLTQGGLHNRTLAAVGAISSCAAGRLPRPPALLGCGRLTVAPRSQWGRALPQHTSASVGRCPNEASPNCTGSISQEQYRERWSARRCLNSSVPWL
jgi:hypothetical protein